MYQIINQCCRTSCSFYFHTSMFTFGSASMGNNLLTVWRHLCLFNPFYFSLQVKNKLYQDLIETWVYSWEQCCLKQLVAIFFSPKIFAPRQTMAGRWYERYEIARSGTKLGTHLLDVLLPVGGGGGGAGAGFIVLYSHRPQLQGSSIDL
jgi:hypothetical protein